MDDLTSMKLERAMARGRVRVLIVDDEPALRAALARLLRSTHDVVTVSSGQEALEQIGSGVEYDAFVVDLLMPGMTGIELFQELERRAPELAARVVFLSGGVLSSDAETFLARFPGRALEKPAPVDDIRRAIERVRLPAAA